MAILIALRVIDSIRKQTVWLLLIAAISLAVKPSILKAQSPVSKEYQIKAVFLFNFAQFVEWPSFAFAASDTPICIGVLGDDPFGSSLDETIRGETIHGRKLVIQHSRKVEDLKTCHLLFISKSERDRIDQILSELYPGAILTVGEVENFASRGGILNFYLEGNKVRFEINPGTAEREKLKLSSQLLSLGKIVKSNSAKESK